MLKNPLIGNLPPQRTHVNPLDLGGGLHSPKINIIQSETICVTYSSPAPNSVQASVSRALEWLKVKLLGHSKG